MPEAHTLGFYTTHTIAIAALRSKRCHILAELQVFVDLRLSLYLHQKLKSRAHTAAS